MNLDFESIIAPLLREAIDMDSVADAIDNKYYVRIKYDDEMEGDQGNPRGIRVIQPLAMGLTKRGNAVLRAFQNNGNATRRGAPKYKFFRLDRIKSWIPMRNKHFFTPPNELYNYEDDMSMHPMYKNAQFGDMEDTLSRERARTQDIANAPKVSTQNASGPIAANQQRKRNVFTSQPNSKKYSMYAKNIKDTENDFNRFDDDIWNAAERERQQQQINQRGPIQRNDDYDDYDTDDADVNEDEFITNLNKR